jgi:uncharacterized membrane protein
MIFGLPVHPMLVHFPIALLIAGIAADVAGLGLKKAWLSHAGLLLLVLGTLGTIAAVWSGSEAEESVVETPAIEATLDTHEDSGKLTMWYFITITVARSALVWRRKLTPAVHTVFVLAWLGGVGLVARTAYYGGHLVYEHGAGVAAAHTGTAAPAGHQGDDDD